MCSNIIVTHKDMHIVDHLLLSKGVLIFPLPLGQKSVQACVGLLQFFLQAMIFHIWYGVGSDEESLPFKASFKCYGCQPTT